MPLLKFVIPVLFSCAVVFGADEKSADAGKGSPSAESTVPPKDVTPLIQKARDEWQAAQKIEQRIREGKPSDDYIKLLNQAEAHYNKAIEIYTQAIVESKNNPIVLSDLGRLCLSRQDRVQARKFLGAAILHNNNMKIFSPSEEADLQRTLGGLLERAGVVNLAMDRYKRAFELNGSDIRNRLSLATAHIATGSPQDAIDLLEAVCAALPAKDSQAPMQRNISALALYTLALGREEIGQPEEALATYRLAAERCSAPELAPDWGVTERAEAAVARLEDAFDALAETAKAREKENEERARRNLPPLPNDRESYAKAARWTTEGVKIRQQALSDKEFLEALAALRAQGETSGREKLAEAASWSDYQLSMDYFQRAASAFPRFSRAYYELGVSSMMLNRPGPARKLMEEAVVCNPNSVAALNLYGDVLLQLGQWAEAQRIFKRLRSLDPESARANLGWARATSALKSDLKSILQAKDALDRSEQLGAAHDEHLLDELKVTEALLRSGKRPPEPPKIRSKAARRSGDDRERQPNFNFWNQGGY